MVIFSIVFGISMLNQEVPKNDYLLIAINILIPPYVAVVLLSIFDTYNKSSLQRVVDKSLNLNNRTQVPIFKFLPSLKIYYYPSINIHILPIFSVRAIFNETTCFLALSYLGVSFLTGMFSFLNLLVTATVAFGICWLLVVAMNIFGTIKIIKNRKKPNQYTIDMKYAPIELKNAIKSQAYTYDFVDEWSGDKSDLLKSISNTGVNLARALNILLVEGLIDPVVMSSEIKTIEYTLNTFIMTTISTTNKFFKKNKANPSEARAVYERDVKPSIMTEAIEIEKTLKKIKSVIDKVETNRAEARRKIIEKSIIIDGDLLALAESKPLPIPAFLDFHELEFNDIERKVAAKNIVTGTLMQLVKAKDRTTNDDDNQKIDNKIEQVKDFVRSLANNTPESLARRERVVAKEKTDILYIENDNNITGSIENMLAVTDRYLESYDNTLPINPEQG